MVQCLRYTLQFPGMKTKCQNFTFTESPAKVLENSFYAIEMKELVGLEVALNRERHSDSKEKKYNNDSDCRYFEIVELLRNSFSFLLFV